MKALNQDISERATVCLMDATFIAIVDRIGHERMLLLLREELARSDKPCYGHLKPLNSFDLIYKQVQSGRVSIYELLNVTLSDLEDPKKQGLTNLLSAIQLEDYYAPGVHHRVNCY